MRAQATVPVRSVPIVVSSRLREETRAVAGIDVSVFTYRDLSFGAGLPVWLAPTQVDAIRFFFLASLGTF